MEKVPGHQPHRQGKHSQEQDPQDAPRVIVWSLCPQPCPERAKRWEQRLARLGLGPAGSASCPHVLRRMLDAEGQLPGEPLPGEPLLSSQQLPGLPATKTLSTPPVVLLDLDRPLPKALAPGARALPQEAWPLLSSHPVVAVVPWLTWKEAGPWLLCGARGVVAWQSGDEDVAAVLEAARNAAVPEWHAHLQRMLSGDAGAHTGRSRAETDLSPREREVLPLLCEGLSNGEIGRRLFVSEDDIRHHLKNLYRKVGTSNRIQVLLISLSNNWVSLQDLLERLG